MIVLILRHVLDARLEVKRTNLRASVVPVYDPINFESDPFTWIILFHRAFSSLTSFIFNHILILV